MTPQIIPGSVKFCMGSLKNGISFFRDPVVFVQKNSQIHGDVFAFNIFGMPFLFLCDSNYKDWISKGEGNYLKNDWQPTLTKLFWKSTLPLLEGEKHLKQRQITSTILQNRFMSRIDEIRNFINLKLSNFDLEKEFVCEFEFKKLTSQISAQALIGKEVDLLQALDTWVAGFFAVASINLPWTKFGAALRQKQIIKNVILSEIRENRGLFSFGDAISDESLAEELQHLFFASYSTTAVALTNCIMLLSVRNDLRLRLRFSILSNRDVLSKDPLACPELNNFIFYILTKIPSVIGIFRETTRDCGLENYIVPSGWKVVLQPSHETLLCNDESILKNKTPIEEIFSCIQNRNVNSFYPFGGGARACQGKNMALNEIAMILISFLAKYDWTLSDPQNLTYNKMPFPLPRSGLKIKLRLHT